MFAIFYQMHARNSFEIRYFETRLSKTYKKGFSRNFKKLFFLESQTQKYGVQPSALLNSITCLFMRVFWNNCIENFGTYLEKRMWSSCLPYYRTKNPSTETYLKRLIKIRKISWKSSEMEFLTGLGTGLALGPTTLLKKRLWPRCFPVNVVKFFHRTPLVAASRYLFS